MIKRTIPILAMVTFLLSASIPLFAHHGTAAFESDKKIALKGTVTEWFWSLIAHCPSAV